MPPRKAQKKQHEKEGAREQVLEDAREDLDEGDLSIEFGGSIVGGTISLFWEEDKKWFRGEVQEYDPKTGKYYIVYEDGDKHWEDLQLEVWQMVREPSPAEKAANKEAYTAVAAAAAGEPDTLSAFPKTFKEKLPGEDGKPLQDPVTALPVCAARLPAQP